MHVAARNLPGNVVKEGKLVKEDAVLVSSLVLGASS